jgi:hypothetical protein
MEANEGEDAHLVSRACAIRMISSAVSFILLTTACTDAGGVPVVVVQPQNVEVRRALEIRTNANES